MILEEYAHQAFGAAASFYLAEVADPGAFDRHFAKLFARERRKPPERLNPAERRILARSLRRARQNPVTRRGGRA